LTLAGFETSRSDCTAVCGDGILSAGEECDDGVNDGGYGECNPGCVLGAFCGDGKLQEGESCDDGNHVDGDGCGSGCRNIVVK
jgi:cysteine-rich repeat protein